MLRTVFKSIRNNILVGITLAIPVAATFLIVAFLLNVSTDWLIKALSLSHYGQGWTGFPVRVAALLAILTGFYLLGLLGRNFFGRQLYALLDSVLAHTPLLKGIYRSLRQVSTTLFGGRKTPFKEVVLVPFPHPGIYSMGFLAAPAPQVVCDALPDGQTAGLLSVFVPTTPNPTSGFLIIVPAASVVRLPLTVAESLSFIVSAGAVPPGVASHDRAAAMKAITAMVNRHVEPSALTQPPAGPP